jgi:succinate dehydrogenase hydrophobic anchor subunit
MLLFFAADYRYVSDPLNELLTRFTGTFLGISDTLLQSITGLIMILYLFVYGLTWAGMLRFISRYLVRLIFANAFLAYYDRPMAFIGGYKLHQIPSEVCDTLVSYLDLRRLDVMLSFFKDYLAALNVPGTDWMLRPMLWIGQLIITLYEGLLWAAIPISYESVSVLTLLLPLFTFTILLPGISYIFRNCCTAIWQAAFYRVTAAAIVFCAATSVMAFLAHELNGDYTVEQFVAVYPKMVGLMISWVLAFFVIGHLTGDIFKGTSSSGTGGGGMVSTFVSRLL